MNRTMLRVSLLAVAIGLTGCVSVPAGPGVMALPGTGKHFDQFRADEAQCRQYAASQSGGAGYDGAAADSVARSAVLGTVVGAAAGAAIGGSSGAGVGAGAGLLMGTAAGANAGAVSGMAAQRRYDSAYLQCMYAHGHRVPVYGRFSGQAPQRMPLARPTAPYPAAPPVAPYAPAPQTGQYPPAPPAPQSGPYTPMPQAGVTIPPPPPGMPPPPPPGVQGSSVAPR